MDELLGGRGEGAAQNRFVDEVDSEPERVTSCNMAQIVTQLVFLLVAQIGEKSDGGGELVVAEGLESGDGQRGGTEGKRERETQVGVTRLGEVQQAGVENQIAKPRRTESIGNC